MHLFIDFEVGFKPETTRLKRALMSLAFTQIYRFFSTFMTAGVDKGYQYETSWTGSTKLLCRAFLPCFRMEFIKDKFPYTRLTTCTTLTKA